ncbi:LTA synthase family protein [Helicobacter sp. 23-1045]
MGVNFWGSNFWGANFSSVNVTSGYFSSVNFARIFAKSLVFFAFLYVVDFAFRAFFIAYIGIWGGNIGTLESNAEIFQTLINGARYFGQIAGVLALVAFVLFALCAWRIFSKIAQIFIALILTAISFVNIANMGFYEIYGDTFNANLLGLIFDDRGAIFSTAMSGQYNLTLKIFAWIAISVALVVAINAIFRKIDSPKFANLLANPANPKSKNFTRFAQNISVIALFLTFAFATLFAINGHFGFKGISLGKEIRPVGNAFLRKVSIGAFRDLHIVHKAYRKIAHSKFSDYIQGESPAFVAQKFSGYESLGANGDLRVLLQKRVERGDKSAIHHIFYIIAESMSEWHFDGEFDLLDLSSELKKLAKQKGGFKADIFLQNAGNTIKSLDVQISGLLQTDIPLSLLAGRFNDIAFAPAVILRDLGFEGSFFYGGSGSWQKLDSFVTRQGFSRIFFGTHIIENAANKGYKAPYQNEWGAYDNHLFAFIADKIITESTANPALKTFNMIMTTSNHPPYNAPVADFGAPMEAIEKFIDSTPNFKRKAMSAKILAHIWWQDKVIAQFVREMSAKLHS